MGEHELTVEGLKYLRDRPSKRRRRTNSVQDGLNVGGLEEAGVLATYGGVWPDTITTFKPGKLRLAYYASSTPDMPPARFTSLTNARFGPGRDQHEIGGLRARAFDHFETFAFEQVRQRDPLEGSSSTTSANRIATWCPLD
jgi:hypothetical protein